MTLPLPSSVSELRPAWVALIMIYWVMALPHNVSVGYAWIVGLFLDVLQGSLLGSHALALTIIAYIVAKFHLRLRLFPLTQQTLLVFLLLVGYQVLLYWPEALIHRAPNSWLYWLSPLVGMVLWPWVYFTLRNVRRYFQIS